MAATQCRGHYICTKRPKCNIVLTFPSAAIHWTARLNKFVFADPAGLMNLMLEPALKAQVMRSRVFWSAFLRRDK